jgi:hypothetical protein
MVARDKERLEQSISLSPSSPRIRLATHVRNHYFLIVRVTSLAPKHIKFQQASKNFTPTPQILPIPTSDQGESRPYGVRTQLNSLSTVRGGSLARR